MSNKPRHPHRKTLNQQLAKLFRPWHRRLGIASALLVAMVSISGILINHSNQLAIDSSHVTQAWLLDHYGIKPPNEIKIFQTKPLLAITDNLLWLNDKRILEANAPLISAMVYQQMFVAIDESNLYILSAEGELLEQQSRATGLPDNIEAIAIQKDRLFLKTQEGQFVADAELIEWAATTVKPTLVWQQGLDGRKITAAKAQVSLLSRSNNLTWERVLLDLHSGRIVGLSGQWLMDLVALSLIFMAFSGLYLWRQAKPKKRSKRP
ncbi:PepSY-associated TM helix domain-containing protein [Shewanella colwelliana]|nr:PepSY-associated TM helix domain-containing protein [Shewanella colwelliana]MDX1279638.1 PepSY-associated TM helix domain-containing protein [Shewanella colwelliana]